MKLATPRALASQPKRLSTTADERVYKVGDTTIDIQTADYVMMFGGKGSGNNGYRAIVRVTCLENGKQRLRGQRLPDVKTIEQAKLSAERFTGLALRWHAHKGIRSGNLFTAYASNCQDLMPIPKKRVVKN